MKSNDPDKKFQVSDFARARLEAKQAFQAAINAGDDAAFAQAFERICELCAADVRQEYDQKLEGLQTTIETLEQSMDAQVLMARGVRQLTSEERDFWQKFISVASSSNTRQSLDNLAAVMPRTISNHVFDDLAQNHPLLSKLTFINAGFATEYMVNENGYQETRWGELCDEDIKEMTSAFKVYTTMLFKYNGVLTLCKAMLDLGPEWLDNYARSVLYEAAANGWEAGIFGGNGVTEPIGMDKVVGDGQKIEGGSYSSKEAVPITDLSPVTMGSLLAMVSVAPNGSSRAVRRPLMVVNFTDYFEKVFPATTVMAPDGTYRKDVLPIACDIVPSVGAKTRGKAVFGDGAKYIALAGSPKEGMISFSDHYQFPQGKRTYLINGYGNGRPLDNNSFVVLDISGLETARLKVELVDAQA